MKYDEISKELYGVNYDSAALSKLQQARVRMIYDERQGHITIRRRNRLNRRLNSN
jgi:hypothetical protein